MNEPRRRAPRRFQTPVVYEIGKDITQERYTELLLAITDWIREQRPNEKAPGTIVKLRFDECLNGTKLDGTPWYDMDTATLAKRVRSKLRYDIDTMEPLRTASEKTRTKKDKEKVRASEKRKTKHDDRLLPDAMREQLRREFKYGDDPNVFKTNAEDQEWHRIKEAYLLENPELNTINGEAELNALCDVHIEMNRFRAKRAHGEKLDNASEAATIRRFVEMKKALGIHPEQLAKRTKSKTAYSVGEAVLRLENMGDKWYEVRDHLLLEEFLQIWKMYNTPNATGTGWQLDEVGLFGVTRCRPIPCPKCGTIHVFGLPIEMIQAWLEDRDILVEDVEELNEDTTESGGDVQKPA